jgi:hypothetical protein
MICTIKYFSVRKAVILSETKEATRIGHSRVPFQPEYSGEGRDAQNEMRYV